LAGEGFILERDITDGEREARGLGASLDLEVEEFN
jgi:hypothetical protein